MSVSLTELRQRLFALADRVIDTGEALVVVRRGVRLRLMRDDAPVAAGGRLARLCSQELVVGPALRADESPAQWLGADATATHPLAVADDVGTYGAKKRRGRRD